MENEMRRKPVIAVIGLAVQGLVVLRLFARAGWDVYVLMDKNDSIAGEYSCSRYGHKSVYGSTEELKRQLSEIAAGCEGPLTVLITSADPIGSLPHECPELWSEYRVLAGPLEAVKLLSDKRAMYALCGRCGLETAPYELLSDYITDSIKRISPPLVLKRNVEKPGLYAYKCIKIDTTEQLQQIIVTLAVDPADLILQECIGDDFIDVDLRGYVHEGRLCGCALVDEVRTYPSGVPSFLREIGDPAICGPVEAKVEAVLAQTGYTGFIGIDLKYRPRDGRLYILDINPRPPASLSSWVYKYSEASLRRFFARLDEPPMLDERCRNVQWCNLKRDLQARAHDRDYTGIGQSFSARKDVWDLHDPLPFLLSPFFLVWRKIKGFLS